MANLNQLELKVSLNRIKKIIEKINFIGICLLAISPFIGLFVMYDQFGSNTDFLLNDIRAYYVKIIGWILLTLGVIGFGVNFFLYGKKNTLIGLVKNPWNILLFLVIIFSLISFSNSVNFSTSMTGYRYSQEGFTGYLAYWGIYIAASNVKRKELRIWIFRTIIFASSIICIACIMHNFMGVHGVLCEANGREFVIGTFLNQNHFGYYLCVTSIISLAMFIYEKNVKWKIFYGFIYGLNLFILISTDSFGPLLAFLFAMLLFVLFTFIRKEKENYKIIVVTAFLSFVFISGVNRAIVTEQIPGLFKDVFKFTKASNGGSGIPSSTLDDEYATASGRNRTWMQAFEIIGKNPITGTGIDSALQQYARMFGTVMVPHNEYLTLAIGIGIPGALCYLVANLYILIRSITRVNKLSNFAMIAALATGTYFISSMFGVSSILVEFIFFIVLGMLNSHYNEKYQKIEIN